MTFLAGNSELKSGYSTGSCVAAALQGALELFFTGNLSSCQRVFLPSPDRLKKIGGPDLPFSDPVSDRNEENERDGEEAILEILDAGGHRVQENPDGRSVFTIIQKPENDDQDVTAGARIRVFVTDDPDHLKREKNSFPHNPFRIGGKVFLHAGRGLGVVTLSGLRIPPGLPAINPGPLWMIGRVLEKYAKTITFPLHVLISVQDGEELARKTANEKVGVLGGISILGSRGIVKPMSNEAYLESLRAEISVAVSISHRICFALGNHSVSFALSSGLANRESLIETGNFVYEALLLLVGQKIHELTFVAGTGKMARVALGYRNTHSHLGDVSPLDLFAGTRFEKEVDLSLASTFRSLEEMLLEKDVFFHESAMLYLVDRATESFASWIAPYLEGGGRGSDRLNLEKLSLVLLDARGVAHRKVLEGVEIQEMCILSEKKRKETKEGKSS